MKVLLVKLSYTKFASEFRREHIPLGLSYISAYLKMKGIDVSILDGEMMGIGYNEIVNKIKCEKYDIIGFTVIFRDMMIPIIKAINMLRESGINSHITIGGHYPSFEYEYLLNLCSGIDSILRFEGELAFYELVKCIKQNGNLRGVPNIAIKVNDEIYVNENIVYEKYLDKLPFPDRLKYNDFLLKHDYATIISSRGCYGNCSFCSIASFYRKEKCTWRGRSINNIIEEMKFLQQKYNVRRFDFLDDNIFGPGNNGVSRMEKFCIELERFHKKITFTASARSTDGNRLLYEKLHKNGLIKIMFGIESGNTNSLNLYNKCIGIKQNKSAIKMVYELGIVPEVGFIFFEPYMTFDDAKENIKFLYQIKEYIVISLQEITNKVDILPGTILEKKLLEDNHITHDEFSFKEGYYYQFKDKRVSTLWDILDKFKHENGKLDIISLSLLLTIWMKILEIKHINKIELNDYMNVLNELKKINNENILHIIDVFILEIKMNGEINEILFAKLCEERYECLCRILSVANFLRAKLEQILLKEEVKNENKDFELTSLLN